MFSLTRIYSDDAGESHFEDVMIPIIDKGEIGFLSESQPVKNIIFREVLASYDYDFHNAPQKQYIILLDGGVEIKTSFFSQRSFNFHASVKQNDILAIWRIVKIIVIRRKNFPKNNRFYSFIFR